MKCRYSYILKRRGWPRTRLPVPAKHPKAMVFWVNEHSNSWTFWMLWKLKEEIHMARRDNQTFSSEKSLQQKQSVPWNHLILFATLKKKSWSSSLPESIEMAAEHSKMEFFHWGQPHWWVSDLSEHQNYPWVCSRGRITAHSYCHVWDPTDSDSVG